MSSGRGTLSRAELIWQFNSRGVFRSKQQQLYDYAGGRQPGEGEERRSPWWVRGLGGFPRMPPKFQPPWGTGAQGIEDNTGIFLVSSGETSLAGTPSKTFQLWPRKLLDQKPANPAQRTRRQPSYPPARPERIAQHALRCSTMQLTASEDTEPQPEL